MSWHSRTSRTLRVVDRETLVVDCECSAMVIFTGRLSTSILQQGQIHTTFAEVKTWVASWYKTQPQERVGDIFAYLMSIAVLVDETAESYIMHADTNRVYMQQVINMRLLRLAVQLSKASLTRLLPLPCHCFTLPPPSPACVVTRCFDRQHSWHEEGNGQVWEPLFSSLFFSLSSIFPLCCNSRVWEPFIFGHGVNNAHVDAVVLQKGTCI